MQNSNTVPINNTETIILENNQKWIPGFEGRYAVDANGAVTSYCRKTPYTLKTTKHSGTICVRIFDLCETRFWSVADFVAEAFLGSNDYIFKDGDRYNVVLDNLLLREEAFGANEKEIKGFGGQYTIDANGDLWSYKRCIKRKLKWCDSLCRSKRATLYDAKDQQSVYKNQLMDEYFGTT